MNTIPGKQAPSPQWAATNRAFTLIELLVVISVIAVIAAMTLGVMKGVSKTKYINTARSEMAVIQSALEGYKSVYGFYPAVTNFYPLYYELSGTTSNNSSGLTFVTLDGTHQITAPALFNLAGVSAIINCTRGSGDDQVAAKTFLAGLKSTQLATNSGTPFAAAFLVTSVGGPDSTYQPLGIAGANEWRYNGVNPTNNPGSYDLYIQLQIGGTKYLISNWSKENQVNNGSYP